MTAPTHGAVLDADGWIEWTGGSNPVPGQRVEVRLRNGREYEPYMSDEWAADASDPTDHWRRAGDDYHQQLDIIAYRLARPTPEVVRAAQWAGKSYAAELATPPAQPEPGAGEKRWTEDMEMEARREDYDRGVRDGEAQAQAKIARLEGEVAELRAERAPGAWKDREDEWSCEVSAAHPTNATNPDRWTTFETAMKMVGNRHGKYALVGLVHWLLTRALSAEADAAKVRGERDAMARTINSLVDPKIDHTGAKRRLMTMRRAQTERRA